MIIQSKLGNIAFVDIGDRFVDVLPVEWYETNKRILHKRTVAGKDLAMRFLNERPALAEGDLLYEDETCLVKVAILPCEVIVVKPASTLELATLCYEIGNKHLPLYMEGEEVLIPYDEPLFRLLAAGNYRAVRQTRQLLHPLQSTVAPHPHEGSPGLLSRILKRTSSPGNG